MSCFVLTEDFYAQLANELAVYAENTQKEVNTQSEIAAKVREYLGFSASLFEAPTDAFANASAKAQALYATNCAAFDARYKEDNGAPEQIDFVRKDYWPQWSPSQFFKFLQATHYQLCEDATFHQPLTKELQDLIHDIAVSLAMNTPEYSAAKWTTS